jgi:putative Holliday junction resolvase
VVTWDERLTTRAAERALREQGARRRKRKRMVDTVAAQLILQSYLDSLEERPWGT